MAEHLSEVVDHVHVVGHVYVEAVLPALPWAWFTAAGIEPVLPERWGYVALSVAYPESVRAAERAGVPLVQLCVDHLAPMTRPHEVAEALATVVKSLVSHI